jgi:hypothetical protein
MQSKGMFVDHHHSVLGEQHTKKKQKNKKGDQQGVGRAVCKLKHGGFI